MGYHNIKPQPCNTMLFCKSLNFLHKHFTQSFPPISWFNIDAVDFCIVAYFFPHIPLYFHLCDKLPVIFCKYFKIILLFQLFFPMIIGKIFFVRCTIKSKGVVIKRS